MLAHHVIEDVTECEREQGGGEIKRQPKQELCRKLKIPKTLLNGIPKLSLSISFPRLVVRIRA